MLREIIMGGVLAMLLSACQSYLVTVEQGNCFSQKQVAALKVGMTKGEVRNILGEPVLTSLFDQNCWNYPYALIDSNGIQSKRSLTLWFKGERLTKIEQQHDGNIR